MTGGAMLGAMKMASAFSRKGHKPTDPIESSIAIKGNRMVRKSADTATVVDLDQKTMMTINYPKKTYSVMTFEQMRQMIDRQVAKGKSGESQKLSESLDVKVDDTGQKRTIAGTETHEMVMTVTMSGTDSASGQTAAMNVVSDMWLGADFQGANEVRDFNQRMGQSLGSIPAPGMGRPEISKAMAEVYKNNSKLNGVPVETLMKVRLAGQSAPGSSAPSTSASNSDSHSDPQPSQPTSLSGAMAGALGQRFGFGHKKKTDDSSNDASSSGAANSGSNSDSLIEMTSHASNFSTGSVDSSLFEVPAGFSQVDADISSGRRAQ